MIAFLTAIFYLLVFTDFDRKNYNIDKTWVDCVGTLVETNSCAECASKFEYNYNNIEYEEYSHINVNTDILGEKYMIKVNPKMPKKYIPLNWKPVFTPDEKTHFTVGITRKISSCFFERSAGISRDSLSKEYIMFEYKIDDKWLEGYQHLSPQYKRQYPNLGIG